MTVYSTAESKTIAELLMWDANNPANAPFVRIGRLLLAVDQTGAEAWQPLVNTLRQVHGAADIMLYSGRHGAMEGCFQDNGQVPPGTESAEFYADDEREVRRFAGLAGVSILVVDTGRLPKLLFKQRVLTDIATGHWVIVSWCHSIAAMCTTPNNAPPNRQRGGALWISAQNMMRRRVRDVVAEDFAWVPRDPP